MAIIDLTHANFDDEIEKHPITIIDFWAPWCAPCRAFAPVFEAAAEKYPDILFAKVNTDEEQELAQQFEIRSIPTLIAAKDGTIVAVKLGALPPAKLEALIQELKS